MEVKFRGRVGLDQHLQVLKTIKINNSNEAMKIFPLINDLLGQIQFVLGKTARNEVLANSKAAVAQKIIDGKIKPIPGGVKGDPVTTGEEAVPIETPQPAPFDDDDISEAEAAKAKAELLSDDEDDESDVEDVKLEDLPKVSPEEPAAHEVE